MRTGARGPTGRVVARVDTSVFALSVRTHAKAREGPVGEAVVREDEKVRNSLGCSAQRWRGGSALDDLPAGPRPFFERGVYSDARQICPIRVLSNGCCSWAGRSFARFKAGYRRHGVTAAAIRADEKPGLSGDFRASGRWRGRTAELLPLLGARAGCIHRFVGLGQACQLLTS